MKAVFVDTSAFYAILDGTDPYHAQATALFQRASAERWKLLTTNYVVHEAWALIQARLGWAAVTAFLDRLLPLCEVTYVDARLHELGAARCQQARLRHLSLTDCVSFETMRKHHMVEAIGSDSHFTAAGFKLL